MNLANTRVRPTVALTMLAMSATDALLDACTRRSDVPAAYRLELLYRAARVLVAAQLQDLDDLAELRTAVGMHLLYPAILSDGLLLDGKPMPAQSRSILRADSDAEAERWFARVASIRFDAVPERSECMVALNALIDDLEELKRWTPEPTQREALQH
jgi:hypothetical protein